MLLLLVFQLLSISTLSWCENDVSEAQQQSVLSLLTIQNSEDGEGAEITIFNNNQITFEVTHINITSHSLSSECGDNYFRCQELLVETLSPQDDDGKFNIVFVPLENGLLLLCYWYDVNTMKIEWSNFAVTSFSCSPTVFYKISGRVYMVCTSSHEYFAVYEVQLHLTGSMIENATLLGPLTEIRVSNSPPTSSLSNFILVEHMVYFAVSNTIIVMDIFDPTRSQQYSELPKCTQIHNLVPSGTIGGGNQQVLVAYCTDRYIYFDPVYGDWTTIRTFSSYGVLYICPSDDYKVNFYHDNSEEDGSYLQFSVMDSSPNTIRNVNISSGICFKSQNKMYFAYSDQQHNSVFVYDFITQNHYSVLPFECINMECPQLLLLEDQYMIIHDTGKISILDIRSNFSLVINSMLEMTNSLYAILSHVIANNVPTLVPTDVHTNIPGNNTMPTSLPQTDILTTKVIPTDMRVSTTGTNDDIRVHSTEQPESTKENHLQLALIIVGSIAASVVIINIIAIAVYIIKRYQKVHRYNLLLQLDTVGDTARQMEPDELPPPPYSSVINEIIHKGSNTKSDEIPPPPYQYSSHEDCFMGCAMNSQ